jgi:tetratricopeptide (TPR) repeat protein
MIAATGCASSSPFNQTFVEVRTPNFVVTSSFGEARTQKLALDLEVFHAGVISAVGVENETRGGRRTRVFAFDGRGVSQPFAQRGAGASLIPTVEGPVIMIRATGNFDRRIDPDLRHRYAHRILRDRLKAEAPLWYEEGRTQVAGTIDVSGNVVRVGRTDPEHQRSVLDWHRTDLAKILWRRDLSEASRAGRAEFEAQTWAFVHTLLFGDRGKRESVEALDRVRRAFESQEPAQLQEAVAALGGEEALTTRVYEHLEEDRHRVDRMQLSGLVMSEIPVAPVAPVEARDRLAMLALDLRRPALAYEYFERALSALPSHVPSQAGLALAAARSGRLEEMNEIVARIGHSAEGSAVTSSRIGLARLSAASQTEPGTQRTELLSSARRAFSRSLELEPDRIDAQMGMGMSYLVSGEEAFEAERWFAAVKAQSPGSLDLELGIAMMDIELKRRRAGVERARSVFSRTHSVALRKRALEVIESTDRDQ